MGGLNADQPRRQIANFGGSVFFPRLSQFEDVDFVFEVFDHFQVFVELFRQELVDANGNDQVVSFQLR